MPRFKEYASLFRKHQNYCRFVLGRQNREGGNNNSPACCWRAGGEEASGQETNPGGNRGRDAPAARGPGAAPGGDEGAGRGGQEEAGGGAGERAEEEAGRGAARGWAAAELGAAPRWFGVRGSERKERGTGSGVNWWIGGGGEGSIYHTYLLVELVLKALLRSGIQILRIYNFLGLLDRDPLVRGTDPDPKPSIIKQKYQEKCWFLLTFYLWKIM